MRFGRQSILIMGLWNWIQTQVTGVDPAAEEQRTQDLNAWRDKLDQQAIDRGVFTQDSLQDVERNRLLEQAAGYDGNYSSQIDQAAAQGAAEGLANMQSTVKDTANSVAGGLAQGLFGFVPWWAWLLGIAAALWYFGLLGPISRKVLRRA